MWTQAWAQGIHAWKNTFRATRKSIMKSTLQKSYQSVDNLASFLPWMAYNPETQLLVLEDGVSQAGFLQVTDLATEAFELHDLKKLRDNFAQIFRGVIPFDTDSPWHLQVYVEEDYNLNHVQSSFQERIKPWAAQHPFTQAYQDCLAEHLHYVSQAEGLFFDQHLTGHSFRGKKRLIHLCLYRRVKASTLSKKKTGELESHTLSSILTRLESHLRHLGCATIRMGGSDIFDWLFKWFNAGKTRQMLCPQLDLHALPYGFDWAEQLFRTNPKSDLAQGAWYFNQEPHQLLSIDGLSAIPSIGYLTRVEKKGRYYTSLMDHLPDQSRWVMNIIFLHPEEVALKIHRIKKSCVGDHAQSQLTREVCEQALIQHEEGNYLMPSCMGIYLKAPTFIELQKKIGQVTSLLNQNGFKTIAPETDLYPLHAYLRYLPANYDYALENKIRRTRLLYTQHIANLLPFYGTYRGSGRSCLSYWTRSGENFSFDPFDSKDKAANSHLLFLAETGGGKSAALVYHLMQVIALYQPRVFIIEAGASFRLFCDYAAHYQLSVHQVKLSVEKPTSLNPFASLLSYKSDTAPHASERDYLGEMSLAAQLMVTGGDPKEEARMTRANQASLLKAIVMAATFAQEQGHTEVLTEHVVACLFQMARSEENSQKSSRLQEMADAMSHFVHDPFSSSFFNRQGEPWPEVDITRLDMGLMKEAQYSAQLAIAVISMLSRILNTAEKNQYQERMTLVLIDEAHILTKNALTAQHITQFSKMCRKLGMWLWFATQNISDFPAESKKMLSMIEFWIGLGTSEHEIDEIRQYKHMTEEEKGLFMSVRKEIPHYVEGVVLSRKIKGLFRNVPPRLALVLGMSEQTEKAERQKIMKEFGISEVEAALKIAENMLQKSKERSNV